MARVMQEQGTGAILDNMGVDATGRAFNSIEAASNLLGGNPYSVQPLPRK